MRLKMGIFGEHLEGEEGACAVEEMLMLVVE